MRSVEETDQHWAINAVGPKRLSRAFKLALSGQPLKDSDAEIVKDVAFAHEIAVLEGQHGQLKQQSQEWASRAYNLLRVLPVPSDNESRMYHVLKLGSIACCGNRLSDFRLWLKDNEQLTKSPSVPITEWNRYVLYKIYDCWIRLFQGQGIGEIHGIVDDLRRKQREYEPVFLSKPDTTRTAAFCLISLYAWAKATELLSTAILQGYLPEVKTELNRHFKSGERSASDSGNIPLAVTLRWLYVALSTPYFSSMFLW